MKIFAALLFSFCIAAPALAHPVKKAAAKKPAAGKVGAAPAKAAVPAGTAPPASAPAPPTISAVLDRELTSGDLLVITNKAGEQSIIRVVGIQDAQYLASPVRFEAQVDYWGKLARHDGSGRPTYTDPHTSTTEALWLLTNDTGYPKPAQAASGKAFVLEATSIKSIEKMTPPVARFHFGSTRGQNLGEWKLAILWTAPSSE